MSNRDIEAARSYHESTKLSYINLKNKPPLYKRYPGLPVTPLPQDDLSSEKPVLDALTSPLAAPQALLDLAGLARILYLSAGLIRKAVLPVAGEVHYRAAASAGALYPVEIYVVCGDLPDWPPVFTISRPRISAWCGSGKATTAGPWPMRWLIRRWRPQLRPAWSLTTNFWRSAWKYRVRSYRYCYWDTGTILANLLAAASASGLEAQVLAGFLDREVNRLLGLDSDREAAVCVAPLGPHSSNTTPLHQPAYGSLDAAPQGADSIEGEIEYPEIQEIHRASSLDGRDEVVGWGRDWVPAPESPARAAGPHRTLDAARDASGNPVSLGGGPLGEAVLQRGSTRRFARESIPFAKFSAVLTSATTPVAADFLPPGQPSLLETYLIANGVEGLKPGSYRYLPGQSSLESLKQGDLRHEAGHLCFEQALGADASAVFYFMADLDQVLGRWGNRGYRAAQLEAGILGGRVYLAAHALGLGASGMTFYDEDVSEFFANDEAGTRTPDRANPNPRKSLMFLVALGLTHQTNRVRPFRSRVGILLDSLARGAGQAPNSGQS